MADADEDGQEQQVEQEEAEVPKFRRQLPTNATSHHLSLWQLLKSAIGKDLTRMSMPIEAFEPLGVLQVTDAYRILKMSIFRLSATIFKVFCEELEYSDLLDRAANENDKFIRMSLVAAFAVSRYGSTRLRGQGKPFNPLETFECIRDDLGWRFFSEQVSHHPSISACFAKGRCWEMSHTSTFDLAFWGRYILAKPKTPIDLTLLKFKETYRWNRVLTTVHNLFRGTRYIDHHGEMKLMCSNKLSCSLIFRKITHEILGHLRDESGETVRVLTGKWSFYLDSAGTRLWTARPLPSCAAQQYGFGEFAVTLNEITNNVRKSLPPTDSRFRPDQKLLEEGNIQEAKVQKRRLEVDQRKRRQTRAEYVPKWFTTTTPKSAKEKKYSFNHLYWKARDNRFAEAEFDQLW